MTRWKVSLLLFALLLLALPIIYNFYGWPLVRGIAGGGAVAIIFVLFGGNRNDTFTFSGNGDGGFDGGGDFGGGFDGGGGD